MIALLSCLKKQLSFSTDPMNETKKRLPKEENFREPSASAFVPKLLNKWIVDCQKEAQLVTAVLGER